MKIEQTPQTELTYPTHFEVGCSSCAAEQAARTLRRYLTVRCQTFREEQKQVDLECADQMSDAEADSYFIPRIFQDIGAGSRVAGIQRKLRHFREQDKLLAALMEIPHFH